MSEQQRDLAIQLVTNYDVARNEFGSPQEALACAGGIVGGVAVMAIAAPVETTISHVVSPDQPFEYTTDAPELAASIGGALLVGAAIYQGIKSFAQRHLSREEYRVLKKHYPEAPGEWDRV